MSMDEAYNWFRSEGLIEDVERWLRTSPPPDDWEGTKWEWAFEEMPVNLALERWTFLIG